MRNKKILAAVLAVALVACLTIGATLAYFTDETDTAKNTFTVGKVDIDLTETDFDEDEDKLINDYGTLMPGTTVAKDPTVTVAEDSEDAYLFVKLDMTKFASLVMMYAQLNPDSAAELPAKLAAADTETIQDIMDTYFTGFDMDAWTIMNEEAITAALDTSTREPHLELILGYNEVVKAKDEIDIFTKLQMPEGITTEMISAVPNFQSGTYQINITAYAIQKANVANLDAAYAAMFPEDD